MPCGIINGIDDGAEIMKSPPVPIDDSGRIVLPKKVRERLHIDSAVSFEVSVRNGEIILKPLGSVAGPSLVQKNGVLVWSAKGSSLSTEQVDRAIQRGREERDRNAMGIE